MGMASIFFLWNLSALIHFATVDHTLCEHGQIVDAEENGHGHQREHNHGSDRDHRNGDRHDDCDTVAAMTTARAMTSPPPDLRLLQIVTSVEELPVEREALMSLEAVLSISPSNSPPSA